MKYQEPGTQPEKGYEARFADFMKKLARVYDMKPRTKYLYPMIDGVAFSDMETALMMALLRYDRATNDNAEKGEE